MNKIDPKLINMVFTLDKQQMVQCVVYATKYNIAKSYLDSIIPSSDIMPLPFISAFGICTAYNNISNIAALECVKYISSCAKVSACIYKSNNFLGMAVAEVAGSHLIFYTHQKNSKIFLIIF